MNPTFQAKLPFLALLGSQLGQSVMQILNKMALNMGMGPFVLIFLRQVVAALCLAPLAYTFEWRNPSTRPTFTKSVVIMIFCCALLGVTGNQCLYIIGLKYSTPTITAAIANLFPAVTFVMGVVFRQEKLNIHTTPGKWKVMGTIISIGGGMMMSFYKGGPILWNAGEISHHLKGTPNKRHSNFVGPVFIIGSCIATAGWLILQAKLQRSFHHPLTTTTLMTFVGSIQCGIVAGAFEHSAEGWSLKSTIKIVAAIYSGVIGSALSFCVMAWCIKLRGPLYVSMFSPIMLIIVAVMEWFLLNKRIYLGMPIAAIIILFGFFSVLRSISTERRQRIQAEERNNEEQIMNLPELEPNGEGGTEQELELELEPV